MANRGVALPLPPQAYLRECFDYDQNTGVLTWRERPTAHFKTEHRKNNFNSRYAGTIAGHKTPRGYLNVRIGKAYLAHRVIWKWMTGRDPVGEVDHRNEDKSCNRWTNLREASHQQNTFNRKAPRTSATGMKGVVWNKDRKKFAAYARLHGKSTFLGYYQTSDAAAGAYRAAVAPLHGDFINA